MRVAITGSTGLIGQALHEGLRDAGHEPIRIVRSTDPGDGPSIRWDPAAGTIDRAALVDVDAVVHLAGVGISEKRWSDQQKALIRDSRLMGTRLISSAIAGTDGGPRVLISASAIGFYGDRGDEILTEQSEPGSGFLADLCVEWEAATEESESKGVRVVHTRTGIVLTPRGGALGPQLPFFKLGLGGRLGSGRQWWSWISLEDQVAALIWLLDSELSGPVNLTAPNPVTNAEFTKTLGQVLNRPTFLPTPKPALWARLGRELTEALVYTSARVHPEALVASGFEFAHPDLETALRAELG